MNENKNMPEELDKGTPAWFRSWHDKAFYHFRYHVESKLRTHDKLLWGIVITVIAGAIVSLIFR